MATNTDYPSSSAAFEEEEEKSEKADFGPGEVKEKDVSVGVLLSDPGVSEQGKKNKGKYPTPISYEEILDEFKCFDVDAQDGLSERVPEPSMANLRGANVAVVDASMGEAHLEAVESVRPNPPMTMPLGHEQELMSGGGKLMVSSEGVEVVMSEGHVIVDGIPLSPMTSPQGREQEVKVGPGVEVGTVPNSPLGQTMMQEALGVRMRPVANVGESALTPMAQGLIKDGGAGGEPTR